MAKNITLMGASYPDVPAVELPQTEGGTATFYDVQGTKNIDTNGTYDVTTYSEVSVNVSGGDTPFAEEKDVNFIDYDGNILYSYTDAEFLLLDSLPANPNHTGLVAAGWNWSLDDAKNYVRNYHRLYVGQLYTTESGNTEIDIRLVEGFISPYLRLAINGSVTIRWGDGLYSTVSGNSYTTAKNTLHNYSNPGDYTISISVNSGGYRFYCTSSYSLLTSTVSGQNTVYARCVQSVRFGNHGGVSNYGLSNCINLKYCTMNNNTGLAASSGYPFAYCYSLKSITIPKSITYLSTSAFDYCYNLRYVSLPNIGESTLSSRAFYNCISLSGITFSTNITNIMSDCFNYAYSLRNYVIPDLPGSVTLPQNVFTDCVSLTTLTIPAGITSISSSAFGTTCRGISSVYFRPTTPPTLSASTVFNYLPTICKIYVPRGTLADYTSATNYPSSSTYTYIEYDV